MKHKPQTADRLSESLNCVQVVGEISEAISCALGLEMQLRTVLIGPSNITHMQQKHPEVFQQYFEVLPQIIKDPDYVGKHPSKGSIEFIKVFDQCILVAVRASRSGKLFVRSMYEIAEEKLFSYLKSGTIIKVKQ